MKAGMSKRALLTVTIGLGLSCGGPQATPDSRNVPMEEPVRQMSELQRLNARAREGAVTETVSGVTVADPFRALETESPLTTEWIQAQTQRTATALDAWTSSATRARLDALLSIGVIGGPSVHGERIFYTKREGEREQPGLFLREGQTLREAPIIDPLSFGERAALDWYVPSPSGRYVAFGISTDGDERSTLRVLDVDDGELEPDTIEHTKWTAIAWLNSEEGFYYRRYPRESEPNYDADAQDSYHTRLFFHALGSDPNDDELVFAPEDGTDFPSASLSADDRWLVITNFRGWSQSDLRIFDRGRSRRGRRNAPDETHPLVDVVVGQDHIYYPAIHDGRLFIVHNDGAPRYRVDAVAPSRAGDRDRWETFLAQGEGAIESIALGDGRLVVHTIENIASRLRSYRVGGRRDGSLEREIALPGGGEVFGLEADREDGRVVFGFSSFVHPPALFEMPARAEEPREIDRVQTDVAFDDIELSQATVTSRDGTEINVYYVHRRGMSLDGTQRVLLTAYGGFNVSLLPGFQRNALFWAERGGVYAVANLRGGSEHGEEWHRAGNLLNKENVFDDMEAVIRWFGTSADDGGSGISRPDRIAITGGSNGGLLMGAMLTRAPETFGACVANVGLYDMVRYHHFPPAELWITEYGSADANEEQARYLHGYSPYHRVRDGVAYPPTLITTADHDSRVHWAHSTKFAARLQAASGQPSPDIYFYMVTQQGHGAGTRRSDTVDKYARLYAFVEHVIGSPAD